jgi:sulfur carrier protein ThiS
MAMNGTITLVSNRDGGKSTNPTVAKGTTVKSMLYAEWGASVDPDKHMVVLNGKVVPSDKLDSTTLKDGDFVMITPTQIKGN